MTNVTVHVTYGSTLIISKHEEPGYYWVNQRTGEGFGPFPFITEATEHWQNNETTKKSLQLVPKDNIIYVDFINKRRMEKI